MPMSAYDDDEYMMDNIQGGGSGQWEVSHLYSSHGQSFSLPCLDSS